MIKRVSMGKQIDGSYGLKISKPGFDVDLAEDGELALDSDWVISNTIAVGAYNTRNKSAGTDEVVYDGSTLGYIPHSEFLITFDINNDGNTWQNLSAFWEIFFYWDSGLLRVKYGRTTVNTQDIFAIYYLFQRPVVI